LPTYYVPLSTFAIVAIMLGYATATFLLMRVCDRVFGEDTTRMKGIRIAQAIALLQSEGYEVTPPVADDGGEA
jgi:predicted permease